ncbi:MAG: sigma-54 dependent transcriptional regulator [Acidobacteriota bacterium]
MIVDDQPSVRFGLVSLLESEGYRTAMAENGQQALLAVRENAPSLVLLDLRLPDMDGLELLQSIKAIDDDVPVIILTAYGTIESAVRALKGGAENFLTKPFDPDSLLIVLGKTLEQGRARRERLLAGLAQEQRAAEYFLGHSEAILCVHDMVERVAQSDATVLLQGETGTGKGMLAQFIHRLSKRRAKPFVTVNCAGLSRELLETELFGHEKGAFTSATASKPGLLELAHEGTFFFDEIAEMELSIQAKVLNVIEYQKFRRVGGVQEREVDVRIIGATNRNLLTEIKRGNFREDLYYRFSVMTITLPPLRARREDIIPLAHHFIHQFNQKLNRHIEGLTPKAAALLESYNWPGNIRELRNIIERAVILSASNHIHARDLPLGVISEEATENLREEFLSLAELEQLHIQRVLAAMGGNLSRTAEALGVTRATLYKKIRK